MEVRPDWECMDTVEEYDSFYSTSEALSITRGYRKRGMLILGESS